MILYQLRCTADHEFEGWFGNSAAFEDQAARGLLSCPYCGTTQVDRALMAPALRMASRSEKKEPEPSAESTPPALPLAGMPDALLAVLQKARQEVESHCENVGEQFADEALRIHRGDAEERGIYGSMTDDEHERLEEEGVSVQRLPWVPRAEG
ncbi:DUF1178 family protein [Acetobacter conturbans]|uniref:DUF1178 family protein n=1 Tax=Acetobacter conturbans TaxID=1737472 RepID=A0ABX0K183_9PROT|nr:DUF1178 family protein [Acetobacter conturbans]NHN87489.1 DUF1178 family protein [Acetobacter conturbans]